MINTMKTVDTIDIIRNLTEMWSDADATLRQQMKTDLTRLVQQMN